MDTKNKPPVHLSPLQHQNLPHHHHHTNSQHSTHLHPIRTTFLFTLRRPILSQSASRRPGRTRTRTRAHTRGSACTWPLLRSTLRTWVLINVLLRLAATLPRLTRIIRAIGIHPARARLVLAHAVRAWVEDREVAFVCLRAHAQTMRGAGGGSARGPAVIFWIRVVAYFSDR